MVLAADTLTIWTETRLIMLTFQQSSKRCVTARANLNAVRSVQVDSETQAEQNRAACRLVSQRYIRALWQLEADGSLNDDGGDFSFDWAPIHNGEARSLTCSMGSGQLLCPVDFEYPWRGSQFSEISMTVDFGGRPAIIYYFCQISLLRILS